MPTNCICAILYICFFVGLIISAVYAFKEGSPYTYTYPSDTDGNICGIDKGFIEYKYIYLLNNDLNKSVCV